ncbi:conserved hypothetical protein [Gloeothece citriformis PCC 7424]|uniref:DUF6972 domain-containing protein n=1 Tax=Gloeothece citriformis (strain PCC 7424) TaxID=65393 RepID=B7KFT2_GLOC7|nr:hypothetical protein [Gloeothece citriformis]ACK73407.1 conserved hypothetical protein [Gloeothece citriformis PCC 7424]
MSGINRQIIPDSRISLFLKHLPNTPQVNRLLKKEGKAYVFNDQETMERVTQAIIEIGERTGIEDETDNYERYGLYFSEPIGYILKADGGQIPLYYAEIKIIQGTDIYHVIPRTKPRRTN